MSALEAGLGYLPFAIVIALAAHVGSRLLPHLGTRALASAGLAVAAGGMLLLARVPPHANYVADLLSSFVILGIGLGLAFVSATVAAMSDVQTDQIGLASGLMTTGHEVGAALGVAVISAIATAAMGMETTSIAFAAAYRISLVTAAVVGLALSVFALLAMPSLRPTSSRGLRMH
jgi:MFS family permease